MCSTHLSVAPPTRSRHLICTFTPKRLLVVLDIDEGRLELPGGNLAIEEDVELTVRAILELRKAKVGSDPADDSGASPDISTLASKVPSGRVEELRSQVDHGDLRDVVGGATNTSAQGTEAHRRRLCDDSIGYGTEGAGEHEGDNNAQDGLCIVGRVVLRNGSANAEDEEEGNVGGGAPEIDGAAAEPASKRQGQGVGNELEARVDQVELEGKVR